MTSSASSSITCSYDLFLSYSSEDHDVVEDIARKLHDEELARKNHALSEAMRGFAISHCYLFSIAHAG